jgi:hypothetical protein
MHFVPSKGIAMPKAFGLLLLIAGLSLTACETTDESATDALADTPADADSQVALNMTKLSIAPVDVRAAFLHEYPDVAIVGVRQLTAGAGAIVYEVNFLRYGQPETARYTSDGTRLGFPAMQPAEIPPAGR